MKILKYLFILGFILMLSSLVIPDSKTGDSRIDDIWHDAGDDVPLLLFYMFWYGLHVAIIFLAIQHPKQWVFLSGAILAALAPLVLHFGHGLEFSVPILVQAFGYALALTGYFIKPPKTQLEAS